MYTVSGLVRDDRSNSHFKPLKMDLTECSETSANINQTPGKHPKVDTVNFKVTRPVVRRTIKTERTNDRQTQQNF
jgi:hypothetical protein